MIPPRSDKCTYSVKCVPLVLELVLFLKKQPQAILSQPRLPKLKAEMMLSNREFKSRR